MSSRILNGIASRLDELEKSVSNENAQLRHLNFNLDVALPKLLGLPEEFRRAIETIKMSLKAFTEGLLQGVLGVDLGEDGGAS